MENKRLIDTEKLQKIMTDIISIFQKAGLNDIEITLIVSELARINAGYQIIQNRKTFK